MDWELGVVSEAPPLRTPGTVILGVMELCQSTGVSPSSFSTETFKPESILCSSCSDWPAHLLECQICEQALLLGC